MSRVVSISSPRAWVIARVPSVTVLVLAVAGVACFGGGGSAPAAGSANGTTDGADSKGSGNGSLGTSGTCVDGVKSTPGMQGDPCPQTGTMCAAVGGRAVACCVAGAWARVATGTQCQCETDASPVACGGGPTNCGNGIIDASEQCDGAMLDGASCSSLGMGTGPVTCDATTCRYDTSMCVEVGPTGGSGA